MLAAAFYSLADGQSSTTPISGYQQVFLTQSLLQHRFADREDLAGIPACRLNQPVCGFGIKVNTLTIDPSDAVTMR